MATIPPQFPLEIRSALRRASSSVYFLRPMKLFRPRAFSSSVKLPTKPPLCTADELHYVSVPNSDWRLALWRYLPPPQAPTRNHPLLLLSGVGTNAIGYDLSPGCSFARHMSGQGFETWILEVRGAGLSTRVSDLKDVQDSAHELSNQIESTAKAAAKEASPAGKQAPAPDVSIVGEASAWDESKIVARLTATFMRLSERLSGFLSEGQSVFMSAKLFDKIAMLLEDSQMYERFNEIRSKLLSLIESRQNSGLGNQIRELTQRLVNLLDDGQKSVSPQLIDLHERLTSTIEDFQKQLDLIIKYDWDFDNYLEEDVPAAIEYVRAQSKPKDGKLFAIGHSMGGILLYAMLSRCAFEGREPCLAAVATLASSVDYTTSDSALKLLIPLADPAQALSVPVVPLGALLAAAYPLSSRPPYVLSWLNDLITATDMMHPEQLEKLVLNNFCTIPAKLLIQLTTAFREGGLRDRSGEFYYKDHLSRTSVPVLALAGDRDLICPPVAVEDTVKLFPENLVTYKVLGEPDGPHYAHYDLVGGRLDFRLLMGLQFHPERMRLSGSDDFDYPGCASIYQEFVKAVTVFQKETLVKSFSEAELLEANTVLSRQQENRLKQMGATVRNSCVYMKRMKRKKEQERAMDKFFAERLSDLISFHHTMARPCSDAIKRKLLEPVDRTIENSSFLNY